MNIRKLSSALVAALALGISPIFAAEVAVTTTTSGGTITEFTPGSAITLRSETATAPVRYVVGDSVTYVDEAGAPVSAEVIRSGVPVTVHYVKEGDRMIARKVVVKKTTTTSSAPVVEERRTKTTTTTIKED
jgi:hypothetical protein